MLGTEVGTGTSRRAGVRRAVDIEAEILCDLWDRPIALPARNLSTTGIWVETQLPLSPGDELIVSFVPPGRGAREPLVLSAEVCRSDLYRRQRDAGRSGMALRFVDADEPQQVALEASLRGLPPPLPASTPEAETCLRFSASRDIHFIAAGELLSGGSGLRPQDQKKPRCFVRAYELRRPAMLRLRPVRDFRPCAGRRRFAPMRRPALASQA